jgi:cytochrome c biogenesis protein CcdA
MDQDMQNKMKAIELNVESLKQYITLSTFAIAGLLTYYSINTDSSLALLLAAVGFFGACTIVSVYNINLFINKLDRGEVNVRSKDARIASFVAIILFLAGVSFSLVFINSVLYSTGKIEDSQLIISKDGIVIGKDYKSKIKIEHDSTSGVSRVQINY